MPDDRDLRLERLETAVSQLSTDVRLLQHEYGELREANGRIDGKLDAIMNLIHSQGGDVRASPAGRLLQTQLDTLRDSSLSNRHRIEALQRFAWLILGGIILGGSLLGILQVFFHAGHP